MPDHLIITLVRHPKFGYLLQPVFASYNPETELYIITETARERASSFHALSEDEKKIVKLAERYADEKLMKTYSQEKNEADFLQKVAPETIEIYIRPFIEARNKEILQHIRITKTPVFWREKTRDRDFRPNHAIEILTVPSKMIFLFRNAETFTYTVQVQNNESMVELFGKFFAPLCPAPAQVVIGNCLHFFDDVDEKKLRPFIEKKQIEVPTRNVPEYIRKFVLQCVKNYDVIAEGVHVFEQNYRPVATLTLETDFELRPSLHLQFRYGNSLFEIDRPYRKEVELIESDGLPAIGWFFRDQEKEKRYIEMLEEKGLERKKSYHFSVKNDNEANPNSVVEWIYRNGQLLRQFCLKQSFTKQRFYVGEIDLQLAVGAKNDWFDILCIVRFGDIEIPFVQFKNHILKNIREYLLPDGSVAALPSEWFVRFNDLFRFGQISDNSVRLNRHHFRVKELVENGYLLDEKTEENQLPSAVPAALNATLRPYQLTGFRWLTYLQHNGFGGCLADDMGLGKTLQTIALLLHVYSETDAGKLPEKENAPRQLSLFDEVVPNEKCEESVTIKEGLPPTLIVMPTSLVHNWLNELEKFAPLLGVYVHTGGNRQKNDDFARAVHRCQVVLTSYGIVRQDIDFLQEFTFQYLILDESQNIKNPSSQIFGCVKQLNALHRLSLTGTPIENSVIDLWAQLDFLNDGILGSLGEFQKRFRRTDITADEQAQQSLLKIVAPFILRRTKEEVAPELPPLTEEIRYCEMSDEQYALYTEEKNKARNALSEQFSDGGKTAGIAALSSLTRLRLLANHPAISVPDFSGESGKFEQIIAHIETLIAERHKVLIFSSFVKHLRLLAEYFDAQNRQYAWLTGSTSDREAEIEKFNFDENIHAFLISLKAGGTGLNLTAADYVFIIDPWWNPAAEMQAVSRAHRIGQNKKVTLYRFITKGTVEEKIRRLQQYKSALTDALVRPQLTMEEVEELLE